MAVIDINWNPSHRELRQFSGIWFPGFFALVGGFVLYHTGSLATAGCIWGPALALSVLGYLAPQFVRPVFVAWICAAYPIGWVVSHVLLAAIFYLVFTPIGLVMRLFGRDPLQRKFERSAQTYWVSHNPARDSKRYFRQF